VKSPDKYREGRKDGDKNPDQAEDAASAVCDKPINVATHKSQINSGCGKVGNNQKKLNKPIL
jgi:hypothetical protein